MHDFSLTVATDSETAIIYGNSSFDVSCNLDTGFITSEFRPISSNPSSAGPSYGGTLTGMEIIDGYKVFLTINVIRDSGVNDIKTALIGSVRWENINDISDFGAMQLPIEGSISIENSFVSEVH